MLSSLARSACSARFPLLRRLTAALPLSPTAHLRTTTGRLLSRRHYAVDVPTTPPPPSPYRVLGLPAHATNKDIKARFRTLAKRYHPDMNGGRGDEDMFDTVVEAYDALMDDDFGGRVQDSRVALACEVYTIAELRADRFHDVYALRIAFGEGEGEGEGDGAEDPHGGRGGNGGAAEEGLGSVGGRDGSREGDGNENGNGNGNSAGAGGDEEGGEREACGLEVEEGDVDGDSADGTGAGDGMVGWPTSIVNTSPLDSVSDLKRLLQEEHGEAWGLLDGNRRLDRDKLATGWEVVFNGTVLSYHLFLHDYHIRGGTIIHAVVRRYVDDGSTGED